MLKIDFSHSLKSMSKWQIICKQWRQEKDEQEFSKNKRRKNIIHTYLLSQSSNYTTHTMLRVEWQFLEIIHSFHHVVKGVHSQPLPCIRCKIFTSFQLTSLIKTKSMWQVLSEIKAQKKVQCKLMGEQVYKNENAT